MAKKEVSKKTSDGLKALFIVVGAVVTIGAVLAALYGIFKKYFKISIECGDECDEGFDDDFDDFEASREDCCGCEPDVTIAEDAEIFGSDKDEDEDEEGE